MFGVDPRRGSVQGERLQSPQQSPLQQQQQQRASCVASRLFGITPAAAVCDESAPKDGSEPAEPSFGASSAASSATPSSSAISASEVALSGCNPDALQTRVRLGWSSEEGAGSYEASQARRSSLHAHQAAAATPAPAPAASCLARYQTLERAAGAATPQGGGVARGAAQGSVAARARRMRDRMALQERAARLLAAYHTNDSLLTATTTYCELWCLLLTSMLLTSYHCLLLTAYCLLLTAYCLLLLTAYCLLLTAYYGAAGACLGVACAGKAGGKAGGARRRRCRHFA